MLELSLGFIVRVACYDCFAALISSMELQSQTRGWLSSNGMLGLAHLQRQSVWAAALGCHIQVKGVMTWAVLSLCMGW